MLQRMVLSFRGGGSENGGDNTNLHMFAGPFYWGVQCEPLWHLTILTTH